MSIRSLADFNGAPWAVAVTGWHRHRHRPGPQLPLDTTSRKGWGLLHGHQRGPHLATSGDFFMATDSGWPRDYRDRYREMARTLGFRGPIAWAEGMP